MNKDCTGCGTCVLKCPKHCITMKLTQEGFYYPIKDTNNCINCNLCEKVCHLNHSQPQFNLLPKLYAFVNNNPSHIKQSSSGGFFPNIASHIINEKGIVFVQHTWMKILI